jgi:hypothetical protein
MNIEGDSIMKTSLLSLLVTVFLSGTAVLAQSEGDVIINEIGNNGTQQGAYTGGDYVELLVLKSGGINLAGWHLTDLSSLTGTPKATEGRIRFSDAEGSIFRQVIPQGTYVLIWLSAKDSVSDLALHQEDVSLNDGNNRVVVFAHNSPKHIDRQEGYVNLTGKDNLALLKSWNRDAAIDALVWGGTSRWTGCQPTDLGEQALGNGTVVWFVPEGTSAADFKNNAAPQNWKSSAGASNSSPVWAYEGIDDSSLQPVKK